MTRDAQSVAWAINEHGVVVGRSDVDELETRRRSHGFQTHGFAWLGGRMIDLGTLGGDNSDTAAINNRNQIVGWADKRRRTHAVLWTPR